MGRYPAQSPLQNHAGAGPYLGAPGSVADWGNQLYQHYFQRLMAVAVTRYRWEGFGDWIDPMRLEWLLVTQGLAAFTFVNQNKGEPTPGKLGLFGDGGHGGRLRVYDGRFAVTQATVTGFLDDSYTPSSYRTFAPTGANGVAFSTFMPLEQWKGVPIWGSADRSRYDLQTIITFARRLAHASLVVDKNLEKTMRGVVAVSNQDDLKTTQIAMTNALGGLDQVVADEKTVAALKTFDFGVHPDHVERSHVVAMRLWSEALEALGIQSPAAEKKERLVVDEIGADNSQVAAVRRLTLTPRRRAADQINRRFFGGAEVIEVVDQWD